MANKLFREGDIQIELVDAGKESSDGHRYTVKTLVVSNDRSARSDLRNRVEIFFNDIDILKKALKAFGE